MFRLFSLLIFLVSAAMWPSMTKAMPVQNLNIRQGLSNNFVTAITQDSDGFIWVGTEAGLNRFDGHEFTRYLSADGLKSDAVTALHYDKTENRLWIGTKSGLSVLDLASMEFVEPDYPKNMMHYNITYLSPASDGGVWIVNHYGSVTHYNPSTKKFTVYSAQNVKNLPNELRCAADDGSGNLFVGHYTDGLSIVDMKKRTARRFVNVPGNPTSLPGDRVQSIFTDSHNNVWVGTTRGLARYNRQTGDFTVYTHISGNPRSLAGESVFAICESTDGNLWVGTDIGGVSFTGIKNLSAPSSAGSVLSETPLASGSPLFGNITATNDGEGVASKNIRALFQDSFGNIWIGNYSAGVDFIPHIPSPFSLVDYSDMIGSGRKPKGVWSVMADRSGDLWVGSENEVARFRNNSLVARYDISPYLTRPYDRVEHLAFVGPRLLVAVDNNGILELNPETGAIRRIPMPGNFDAPVNSVTPMNSEQAIITAEDGIYLYDKGAITRPEAINSDIKWLSVNTAVIDHNGRLWLGTYGGGVSVFDAAGKLLRKLDAASGLPYQAVKQLYLDSRGWMWIVAQDGLAYLKDPSSLKDQPVLFDTQGSNVDTNCRAITEDSNGNIWISANNNLTRWNRSTGKLETFDHHSGLPQSSFMDRAATVNPVTGELYFGSLNGIWEFTPQSLSRPVPLGQVRISGCEWLPDDADSFSSLSIRRDEDGSIELPYDRNSVKINFSVPDYALGQYVEYSYRMDGLDKEWHSTGEANHVVFRNLAPGKYTFRVRARIRNSQNEEEVSETEMKVTVIPPIWLRWYAIVFYAICLAGVAIFLSNLRMRRVRRRSEEEIEVREARNEQRLNNERLRFYTNISHELRTPLTLIVGPLEDLSHEPKIPSEFRRTLSLVHQSALKLLELINQLLEFRKTETANRRLTVQKASLAPVVTELALRFKEFNRNDRIRYVIDIEKDIPDLWFDNSVVTTIINNLLSNANKYTSEGTITISLRRVTRDGREWADITVADTGIGISKDDIPHVFDRFFRAVSEDEATGTGIGLSFSHSLAELHQSPLTVESVEGEGSQFTLSLALDATYPDALHKESQKKDKDAEVNGQPDDALPILLIVEDNADIREYVRASLDRKFKIYAAANGEEGLRLALEIVPDVIVSDIMMPVMNGIELCRKVKEDMRTSHIPVLLLTAKDALEDKEEGYEAGADSYMTKPFSAKLLATRINNILESRRRIREHLASEGPDSAEKPAPKYGEPGFEDTISALDRTFLDKLRKIIHDSLQSPDLSVTLIADRMFMSQSALYRKIKALTEMTANEFLRTERMLLAKKMLEQGASVGETAAAMGYSDASLFRGHFREVHGKLPSAFLRELRKKK